MSFAGLKRAKLTERGEYFTPGVYRIAIERTLFKDTRNGDAWIVEARVIESNREAVLGENPKHENPPAPVGSKRTWFQGFKDKDVAMNSIFAFLVAVMGLDSKKDKAFIEGEFQDAAEDIAEAATGEDNVLEDFEVGLNVVQTTTKKGTEFSRHDFRPLPMTKKPTIKEVLKGQKPTYVRGEADEDEEEPIEGPDGEWVTPDDPRYGKLKKAKK